MDAINCNNGDCERFRLGAEPCTECRIYALEEENARLAEALTELYDCLREAVLEACNNYCERGNEPCEKTHAECFVQRWRTALAKASREEEK